MLITPAVVLATLESTLGKSVHVDADAPLIESDQRVNSLTMFALLSQLERQAGIEVPEQDLIRLSAESVNGIAEWFGKRAEAPAPAGGQGECGESAGYHAVLQEVDLEEGRTQAVVVENYALLVARHQEQIYVVENRCPHQGQELVGALLRRGHIICPHHGARFDLASGAAVGPHTTCPLAVFPIRVVEGRVEVLLPVSPAPPRRSNEAS